LSPSTTTAQHHTAPAITITITSASAHLQPDQRSSTSSFSWSPNPANLFSSYQHLSCTILTSSLSNLRTEQQPSLTQHIVMRATHKLVTACREQRDAASRRLGDYNVRGVVDNKSRDGCCSGGMVVARVRRRSLALIPCWCFGGNFLDGLGSIMLNRVVCDVDRRLVVTPQI
jgi:hypothetical protein